MIYLQTFWSEDMHSSVHMMVLLLDCRYYMRYSGIGKVPKPYIYLWLVDGLTDLWWCLNMILVAGALWIHTWQHLTQWGTRNKAQPLWCIRPWLIIYLFPVPRPHPFFGAASRVIIKLVSRETTTRAHGILLARPEALCSQSFNTCVSWSVGNL